MPITTIQSVHNDRAWGLWKIHEELTVLEQSYVFSTEEKTYLHDISHPHKKLEWLASRLTVGMVCDYLQISYKGTLKTPEKKPYLCEQNGYVSISHSHDYAAAIIDRSKPVGIDIERIDPKIMAIRKKYLFDEEFSDDVRHMTQYWCIKEAGYKLAGEKGHSLKDDIMVQKFPAGLEEGETYIRIGVNTHKIVFSCHDNYVLAFNID
ncbi:MAG: 4'-phosphopantetheinyl transferase superfamily protein [Cytophagales bacterium]|nr:4'-phosphopantetheinyl transferase superfamily protein [Cytophaga sp.]